MGVVCCTALGMSAYVLWDRLSPKPDTWLLAVDAVRQYVPPELVQAWTAAPNKPETYRSVAENLQQQLARGELVARGNPFMADAQHNTPVEINAAQWQSLTISGDNYALASAKNPDRAYDNLEIMKPQRK